MNPKDLVGWTYEEGWPDLFLWHGVNLKDFNLTEDDTDDLERMLALLSAAEEIWNDFRKRNE